MAHSHTHDHDHAHHDHGFKFIEEVVSKPAETDKTLTQYEVKVPLASQKEAYNALYLQMAAQVEVPGFRKGLAPKEVVEPKIFKDLLQRLQNLLLNNALVELPEFMLDKHDTYVVDLIKVDQATLTLIESPMTIKVTGLSMKPKLSDVKKVKLDLKKLEKVTVDEQEIDKAQQEVWQGWFDQNKDEKLKEKYPKVTDEWVKEMLGSKQLTDIASLREFLTKQLTTQKSKIVKEELLKTLLNKMIELSKIDLPEGYLSLKVQADLEDAEERFRSMGTSLEQYLKLQQNKTLDEFKKDLQAQIREQVGTDVLFRLYRRSHTLSIDKESQEDKDFVTAAQQYVQPLRATKEKQPSQEDLLDYAQRVIGVALNIKTQVYLAREAGLDLVDKEQ